MAFELHKALSIRVKCWLPAGLASALVMHSGVLKLLRQRDVAAVDDA
jgi:hypothetical protein